jgi:organic radical activating enzyme
MPHITNNRQGMLVVSWEVTSTCNHSCWYCGDAHRDGKHRWPDLSVALPWWHSICDQRTSVHADLLGGEPTLWPDLITFLHEKPTNLSVEVTTNGSRTLRWWDAAWPLMSGASISYHPSQADPQHIYELCELLSADTSKILSLSLLLDPDHLDTVQALYDRLAASDMRMTCESKQLTVRNSRDQQRIEQTHSDQRVLDMIASNRFYRSWAGGHPGTPTKCWLDGVLFKPADLKAQGRNRFRGWTCTAGQDRLFIVADGTIYRAGCRQGGQISQLNSTAAIDFGGLGTVVCGKDACWCGPEIRLEKWLHE